MATFARGVALLALCAAAGAAAATADATRRYTVLFQDQVRGSQVTTVRKDGSLAVEFTYRNNGRGPDVKEEIVLDRDGTQKLHRLKGTSTFGAPIDETYVRDGATAIWTSVADHGSTPLAQPAVYAPISESSLEGLALAVRALTRQPARRIAALPGGELSLQRLHETTLKNGARRQQAVLYAIAGLDYQPYYVWLTAEPEQRFFAFCFPGWIQVIEAGWEPSANALEALQVEAQSRQLAALVPRFAHRVAEPILIRNARVFDAERALLGAASDVYVHRGRIAAIYPAGTAAGSAATIIDADGRVLLPALFDMHDHHSAWRGVLQVAGGVTTTRDLANENAVLAAEIGRIDAGAAIGPRIVAAGFIEGQSEHSENSGFVVADIDGARRAIDWYAQRGFPQVKLYNSYRREWVAETARYAHERGLRVSGHVPAFMRAEEVVQMGYDELQHINQLMLNFLVGPDDDTRTLARFYLVMDKAHALDLDSRKVRGFVNLLKDKGTVVDPTAATFEDMYQRQGEPHPAYASVIDHLPAVVRRNLHLTSFDVTPANVGRYRASYDRMLELIGRLHRAGVPLVAGTDATAGFALHRELELYVKAGIPAAEVLRIATWNGAKYTRTLDRLGSIAPGKLADLILVDGDPTQNIADIRRIGLVMKEGTIFYPSELYPLVGVKPFGKPVRAITAN